MLHDTYCQLCEKLITKEQWNKHLSLVDIYVEKSMDIGRPFSPKKTNLR